MRSVMKRAGLAFLAVALLASGVPAIAGDDHAAKEMSWTGWITDETCGAKNANAEGKACALTCHEKGAKLVLYVDGDKKLVGLDNQAEAAKNVGHAVTVTGIMEEGSIKVSKIEKKG